VLCVLFAFSPPDLFLALIKTLFSLLLLLRFIYPHSTFSSRSDAAADKVLNFMCEQTRPLRLRRSSSWHEELKHFS
jgi:hypothetical protein